MNRHPNATVAATNGGLSVLVVWLMGYFGLDVSAEVGAAIAGSAAATALFIGRKGIRGVLRQIWHGAS